MLMPVYLALLASVKVQQLQLDAARQQQALDNELAFAEELAQQWSAVARQSDVIDVEARVVEEAPALPAPGADA